MAVAGELHAAGKALAQAVDEGQRILAIAPTHQPERHKLGIGAEGRPGPRVTSTIWRSLGGWHVLGLRIGEGPDFINLDAPAG
jgi:hypothetical protein